MKGFGIFFFIFFFLSIFRKLIFPKTDRRMIFSGLYEDNPVLIHTSHEQTGLTYSDIGMCREANS